MHSLKGVIFSLSDVLAHEGAADKQLFAETLALLRFLLSRGVQPVLVSNSTWTVKKKDGTKQLYSDYISECVGSQLPYYQGGRDMKFKQYRAAMQFILEKHGWKSPEVIYVGSTQEDVQAANNGGFLFVNAKWHEDNSPYGFEFSSPKEVATFIDCCCLIPQDWFWEIEDGPLRVYSIAPFAEYSKAYPEGAIYSTDARQAVKADRGNVRFWGLLMAARIHLSGIGEELDFVAPYPGHSTQSEKPELLNAVQIVAGSLNARYVVDFIVRHTDAPKSQSLRRKGQSPCIENQLNTININQRPMKPGRQRQPYRNRPNIRGKTILIVDDICTQGFSLEAARAFFEAANANVILLTWLKTPGANDYLALTGLNASIDNPWRPYTSSGVTQTAYSNSGQVLNPDAPNQVAEAYTRYSDWDWPEDI